MSPVFFPCPPAILNSVTITIGSFRFVEIPSLLPCQQCRTAPALSPARTGARPGLQPPKRAVEGPQRRSAKPLIQGRLCPSLCARQTSSQKTIKKR